MDDQVKVENGKRQSLGDMKVRNLHSNKRELKDINVYDIGTVSKRGVRKSRLRINRKLWFELLVEKILKWTGVNEIHTEKIVRT